METSAATGQNVENTMSLLLDMVMDRIEKSVSKNKLLDGDTVRLGASTGDSGAETSERKCGC